jgi:hypothetical protein
VNHKSNLQGIPFRTPDSRQTQLPQHAVSRFQINDLGILHGRLIALSMKFLLFIHQLPVSMADRIRDGMGWDGVPVGYVRRAAFFAGLKT